MKKNRKKIIIAIAVLLIILTIVIYTASNKDVSLIQQVGEKKIAGATVTGWSTVELTTDDGLSYKIKLEHYNDNTNIIADYIDSAGNIENISIQSVISGYNITGIGDNGFASATNLKTIILPEGVTSLGKYSFQKCENLETITIPNTLKTIDMQAFYECTNLKNISLPEGLTSIGNAAFGSCENLESINIPSSVVSLGELAFGNCKKLQNITIPDSITEIGRNTFQECTSLQSIILPNGLTSLGEFAFQGCTTLQNITIPENITKINRNTFQGCTSLESITIPNGVTNIENYAFEGCTNLQNVTIPGTVTSIGTDAFGNCGDNLTIKCDKDSEAYKYAIRNNINYEIIDTIAPTGVVTYSPDTPTNKTVTVTITANEKLQEVDGWMLSTDKLKLSKLFYQNITTTVTIKDLVGNAGTVEINVSNIDVVPPSLTVSYSTTEQTYDPVTVKITSNEELQPLSVTGWVLSDNKKELTKIYDTNISGVVKVRDIAGNEADVQFKIENILEKTYRIVLNKNGGTGGIDYLYVVCKDGIYKDAEHTQEVEMVSEGILKIDEMPSKDGLSFLGYNTKQDNSGETEIDGSGQLKYSTYSYMVWSYNSTEDYNLYAQWVDNIPPQVTVSYSTTETTYDFVMATITSNEVLKPVDGWTLIGNCKTMEKKYTKNTKEEVTVSDEAGNKTKVNINIQNIQNKEYKIVLHNIGATGGINYLYVICNDGIYKDTSYTKKLKETEGSVTITELPSKEGYSFNGYSKGSDGTNVIINSNGQISSDIYRYLIYTYESTQDYELYAQWIDNIAPKATVTYSTVEETEGSVTVTIMTNEQIQEVDGWTLSSDKLKLTKIYNENKIETIKIKDLLGNEAKIDIKVTNIKSDRVIGDVNEDGKVDITDLLILKRHIIAGDKKEWIISDDKITLGDINGNQEIDITDLLLMKRLIVAKGGSESEN